MNTIKQEFKKDKYINVGPYKIPINVVKLGKKQVQEYICTIKKKKPIYG